MGHIHAEIALSNPRLPKLPPLKVRALADSGAVTLSLPKYIVKQLKLQSAGTREMILADGKKHSVPYVGPIIVRFGNRESFAGAFAMGDEPLLGAIQMQDMDLVLNMRDEIITTHPDRPDKSLVRM